jgi:hypothetical protein
MQVVPGAVVLVSLDVSVIGSLNLGAPLEVVAAVRSEDRLERTLVGLVLLEDLALDQFVGGHRRMIRIRVSRDKARLCQL